MRDIVDLLVLLNDESLQAFCDRNISWKTLDKLPYRWLVFSQCCPFVAVRFIKHRTSNPAGDSGHTERKIKPKKPWNEYYFYISWSWSYWSYWFDLLFYLFLSLLLSLSPLFVWMLAFGFCVSEVKPQPYLPTHFETVANYCVDFADCLLVS